MHYRNQFKFTNVVKGFRQCRILIDCASEIHKISTAFEEKNDISGDTKALKKFKTNYQLLNFSDANDDLTTLIYFIINLIKGFFY